MASNNLLIYYQNVRGLRTKCLNLYNNILAENYDILLLTETWLQSDVLDSEVCDARYDVFRCDRDLTLCGKGGGGGVMIGARRELRASRVDEWKSDTAESLCVRIPAVSLTSLCDLFIIIVYTPPNYGGFSARIDNVLENISNLLDKNPSCHCLLVGDFNLPIIKWEADGYTIQQGSTELQTCAANLLDQLHFLGFLQYNFISNSKNNILDLCFSNLPLNIIQPAQPLTKIDIYHPPLIIDILDLKYNTFKEKNNARYMFHRGNYEELNKYLSNIDWQSIFTLESIEDDVSAFYETLQECCDLFIPLSGSSSSRSHYPKWYSRALIKIISNKNKMHKKWKRFQNPRDYDEFSLLRDRVKAVQSQCFKEFTGKAEKIVRHNPKYFWTYVKSKKKCSSYPKEFSYNDEKFSEGQNICNAFNTFFESVFTASRSYNNNPSVSSSHNISCNDAISNIDISPSIIEKLLCKLDKSKGAGFDGIPPLFLANCSKTLAYPIYILFKNSLKKAMFPSVWKKALIIPIHKKGSKSNITNYRPISILSTIAKVFEKVIYDGIYQTISRGINTSQHGFLKGRSTASNLALFTNYVLEHMEGGGQIDVIYTDFEKAFDRVDHSILVRKLELLGIHGDLLRWVVSYLSNRSQAVVLGGYRSDFITIPSGVPQGSHLGPLFYNAYIYDISNCINNAKHLLYADDKKVFMRVSSFSDCELIQMDLNNLLAYYKNNNITISISKCQCISFTRKTKPIIFNYKFEDVVIDRVEIVRDLGVLLDAKMSFSNHVENIVNRAYRNLGFVIRTCKPFTSVLSLKVVYYAYVRSILEYVCPIWSPFYAIHKNRIENIQHKFIKHLNFKFRKGKSEYKSNCREFKLLTLEERRIALEMGFLFDVLHGRLDCPELLERLAFCVPTKRTRHTNLFAVPYHTTNYGQNAVLTRILNSYNKMFTEVDPFIYDNKRAFIEAIMKIIR